MFVATVQQQKIIDSIINEEFNQRICQKYNHVTYERSDFETEHFNYFILDTSFGGDYNSSTPSFNEVIDDFLTKKNKYSSNQYLTCSRSQYMLRFSKTYGTLDYYIVSSSIRNTRYSKENLLVLHKRQKIFTVRPNNYILVAGCRYISFKNFKSVQYVLSEKLKNLLLNTHLNSKFPDELLTAIRNLPNKITKNCSSFEDILKNLSKSPIPKILTSKFSTDALITLYSLINESEINKFINFVKQNMDIYGTKENDVKIEIYDWYKDMHFYEDTGILKLLSEYMALKMKLICKITIQEYNISKLVAFEGNSEHRKLLVDYINMAYLEGVKLNINITSLNRLKYIHDKLAILSRSKNIPKIKVSKDFPKSFMTTPDCKIELIADSKELVKEGVLMNNCVASYYPKINRGVSAIYRVLDTTTGERATLELGKDTSDKIYIRQLKAFWNSNPSEQLIKILNRNINTGVIHVKTTELTQSYWQENDDLPF